MCDPVHTHELSTVCDPIHTDELPTIHTDMAVATETGAIILNEIMDMQLMLDEAEGMLCYVESNTLHKVLLFSWRSCCNQIC